MCDSFLCDLEPSHSVRLHLPHEMRWNLPLEMRLLLVWQRDLQFRW